MPEGFINAQHVDGVLCGLSLFTRSVSSILMDGALTLSETRVPKRITFASLKESAMAESASIQGSLDRTRRLVSRMGTYVR